LKEFGGNEWKVCIPGICAILQSKIREGTPALTAGMPSMRLVLEIILSLSYTNFRFNAMLFPQSYLCNYTSVSILLLIFQKSLEMCNFFFSLEESRIFLDNGFILFGNDLSLLFYLFLHIIHHIPNGIAVHFT